MVATLSLQCSQIVAAWFGQWIAHKICRNHLFTEWRHLRSFSEVAGFDTGAEMIKREWKGSDYCPWIEFKAPTQLSWCWCNQLLGASQSQQWPHHRTWRTCGICLFKQYRAFVSHRNADMAIFFTCCYLLLTNFQGKVDAHVHILSPHVIGGFGVENRVDATVKVALAGSLTTAGHSNNGGTGPVPWQQVSRPVGDRNVFM